MDPISQGAVAAAFAQASQTKQSREKLIAATWIGAAAGMSPDLDVFIRSSTDPLLFLEFHRHFTHALIFIPIGAAIVATTLHWFVRKHLSYKEAYLACLLAYCTHGLLDACTTYGTQLLQPFSDYRVAWNNISVVDPLFTVPLVIGVILACRLHSQRMVQICILWIVSYLSLGWIQMERATTVGAQIAATRGHQPSELSMKPSFGNLLVWKSIYAHEGRYYVDGIRTGWDVTVCPGTSVEKLDRTKHLPFMQAESQQAIDLERFRWFSQGYLAATGVPGEVTDMRYSMVPNQVDPMWGITLTEGASSDQHIEWWTRREADEQRRDEFFQLLTGASCYPIEEIEQLL